MIVMGSLLTRVCVTCGLAGLLALAKSPRSAQADDAKWTLSMQLSTRNGHAMAGLVRAFERSRSRVTVTATERTLRIAGPPAEIDRLASDGPTEAELARARNTHLADFYKSLDHLQTRADLLNHYQHVLGDPDGVARDVARYERTTAESVREAFARVAAARHLDLRISPEPSTAAAAPVTA